MPRMAFSAPMKRALPFLLVCACGTGASPPAATCPSGARTDDPRAARLASLLGSTDEGHTLADGWLSGVRRICFEEGSLSVITHEHVVLLDARMSDEEAAARLGHLLVHERDGHPMSEPVTPSTDCTALVHEALVRESRAYAAESRLRTALAVHDPVLAFEPIVDAEPRADPEASARWLVYLEAHPTGAPGIDALGAGYFAQCERDRTSAR